MKESGKQSFLLRWDRLKIIQLGVLMTVTSIISIFYFDQPLAQWSRQILRESWTGVAEVISWFGLGDTYFYIAVLGYLLARLFSQKLTHLSWSHRVAQAKGHFSFMFLSFLVSGVLVLTLKAVFGRCRPYFSPDYAPLNFNPFTLDWNFQSYPSGHTQVGFTLAAFLSILFPRRSVLFFALAVGIGFSRVVLEKHYLGDVIAGAYVGILGTYLTWHWRGKELLRPLAPKSK